MKTMKRRPRKLILVALIAMLMTITLSLGTGVASATTASGITIPTFPDTYIMTEYRYLEGQTINVPPSMNQFGRQYNLVQQYGPMLESTLPSERVYNYRITGALSQAQFDLLKASNPNLDIDSTKVDIVSEREVDKTIEHHGLPNNDIANVTIAETMEFEVSSATSPTGKAKATLALTGVKFQVETWEIAPPRGGDPNDGLPATYEAIATYRGLESFNEVGYTLINATYQTRELDSEVDQYIVVAVYAPVGGDVPVTPPVIGPGGGQGEGEGEGEGGDIVASPPPIDVIEDAEPPLTDIPEEEVALTDIPDEDVALSDGRGGEKDTPVTAGSVLSTIFMIVAIAVAVLLIFAITRSRKEQYKNASAKSATMLLRALVFITSALTIVAWLMYDGITQPATLTNEGTLFVGIILAVNVILFVIATVVGSKSAQASQEERKEYTA